MSGAQITENKKPKTGKPVTNCLTKKTKNMDTREMLSLALAICAGVDVDTEKEEIAKAYPIAYFDMTQG